MNHTIQIEKLIHSGKGLARLAGGMVVMTPFVLPGETVLVREAQRKRGHIEAEPLELIEPSPERVAPPCKYYMQCGGCDLQHMSLAAQHQAKGNIIRELLQRAGVVPGEQAITPVMASPLPFHYRHRMRMQISPGGEIGFHRAGSNTVVDIERCLTATEPLNNALRELRDSGIAGKLAPAVKEVELLHSPSDDRVFCILHPHDKQTIPRQGLPSTAFRHISVLAVRNGRTVEIIAGDKNAKLSQDFASNDRGRSYTLSWTPGCFFQGNAGLNAGLVRHACGLTENSNTTILDLFCGMGNFAVPLALQGARVTGIEHNPESVALAISNAAGLQAGAEFLDRDVSKWLRRAVKHSQTFDTVFLDPPRQGMGRDIDLLAALQPSHIIYISCDPATLARDTAYLAGHGYSLENLTPFDMFPQTHHIESAALLRLNG